MSKSFLDADLGTCSNCDLYRDCGAHQEIDGVVHISCKRVQGLVPVQRVERVDLCEYFRLPRGARMPAFA